MGRRNGSQPHRITQLVTAAVDVGSGQTVAGAIGTFKAQKAQLRRAFAETEQALVDARALGDDAGVAKAEGRTRELKAEYAGAVERRAKTRAGMLRFKSGLEETLSEGQPAPEPGRAAGPGRAARRRDPGPPAVGGGAVAGRQAALVFGLVNTKPPNSATQRGRHGGTLCS